MIKMEPTVNSQEFFYKKAKKQAREIRGFYINLLCYCLIIPILIYINLTYTPEIYWFIFSATGWGIGLTFHGMGAFNRYPFLGKGWEERKIQEILDKEENNTKNFENKL